MNITIKRQVVDHCIKQVEGRLNEITAAIQQARDSLGNETKSSAGDKYETSREMIQQDLSRYDQQLVEAKKDWVLLREINIASKKKVEVGAAVVTDQATYFLAVSLGKQTIGTQDVIVISSLSPIGKLLLGKVEDETFSFNGVTQRIKAIY